MIGQRLAIGIGVSAAVCSRSPGGSPRHAGNIAVEIFKPERQLIGIEALGATAELRALQLLMIRSEALDLAVAAARQRQPISRTRRCRRAGSDGRLFEIRSACSILLERADSKKQVRYIRCRFLHDLSRLERAAICVRARASRCPRSASRAAPETA